MDLSERIDLLDEAIDTFQVMKQKGFFDDIRRAVDAGVDLPDIDIIDKLELFEQECQTLRDALQLELDEEEEEETEDEEEEEDDVEELDEKPTPTA